jgi:hypothetical protein
MRFPLILGAAIAGAAVIAAFAHQTKPAVSAETVAQSNVASQAAPASAAAENAEMLEGEILEIIDVPGYTYVRLSAAGSEGQWAAVSTTKLEKGQKLRLRVETKLTDFPSKTLNRTFSSIYFGAIADGAPQPSGALPSGGVQTHGSNTDPHPATATAVQVGSVEKAEGGHRIADLFARRSELSGKTVRVRGVVVKSMGGIMGKTFVHLQDGSGSAERKDHDLTLTTSGEPKVGETMLVEGTLVTDKDLGAGYRYSVLLEDARALSNGQ